MALLPLAALLLKFNRGRLPRRTRAPLLEVLFTLAVVSVMIGGNIAIDPTIVGYVSVFIFFFKLLELQQMHCLLVLL